MAGVGPFISNPDTPLSGAADGKVQTVLDVVAILRHALPGCNLPATTALDSLAADGRELGIDAGANVIMPVLTPEGNKERYTLYPNKRCLTHNPVGCVGCSKRRLAASGYSASDEKGWSKTASHASRRAELGVSMAA
jgi:biotin synthase